MPSRRTWGIHGFKSKAGLAHFESAYERFHRRGYESSMSACLNWMAFQASIVRLSLDEIRPLIKEQKVKHGRHISGGMDFVPLIADAEKIWEAGAKPELIK